MNPPEHSGDAPPAGASATLGDVLYAREGQPLVSEAEWVALVRAVAGRDQSALHALYERSHRVVFTLAMRITSDPEIAEEVTLDVFHDVWRRAWSYDAGNGTVLGWIMNQARSRAIDRLRFEHRKKRRDPPDRPAQGPGTAADPADMLQQGQQAVAVRAAVAGLTPQERQAIEATYFAGLTHVEAAARLKEPLGTVKTRIRSGLHKLRRALRSREHTP